NFPNPFNPATRIRFTLPHSGEVTLIIYNILGQKVRQLLNKAPHSAGSYTIEWDGINRVGHPTSSGVYMYRIEMRDAEKRSFQ
ncbi:MAG TPA: hypothetical protein DIT99_06710, partial [Candidatus Latescibacteria bacterium]|nr:hypothetical protein [Candidatus Latescibacterota bacterium]